MRLQQSLDSNETNATKAVWPHDPPVVSDSEAGLIREALASIKHILTPASAQQIIGHVLTAFTHYYMPDVDERVAEASYLDWESDLRGFPKWTIAEAFQLYRRTETRRRPGPGDIRRLCQQVLARECRILEALREIVDRHDQDPAWRWQDGDPEPPVPHQIHAQRLATGSRNYGGKFPRLSTRQPQPGRNVKDRDQFRQAGSVVEWGWFVGWGQDVGHAKAEVERRLNRFAKGRRIVLSDVKWTQEPADEGLVLILAGVEVIGWTDRDLDEAVAAYAPTLAEEAAGFDFGE